MSKEQKIYFISDLHLQHKNILTLCNRRFLSIEEHDEHIIKCINETCTKADRLIILGDLGYHKDLEGLRSALKRIQANVEVILGNHDCQQHLVQLKREGVITDVKEFKTIQKGNKHIVCCHYPLKEWNGYYRGYYHVFGHVHGTLPQYDRCLDVGVDNIGYYPMEFDDVIKTIDKGNLHGRISKEDEMINEFFPNLSTHYFVGLCTGHPKIRQVIKEVLEEGSKGYNKD